VPADLTVERILTILSETPDRLAELTAGITPAQLTTAPEAGEWSAVEVLAHLRSCSDAWGDAIDSILAEDHPTIATFNAHSGIEPMRYRNSEFRTSLRAYTRQRAKLLTTLEELRPRGWERAATVTGAGTPLEKDVHAFAQRLARHERPHIKQIQDLVTG